MSCDKKTMSKSKIMILSLVILGVSCSARGQNEHQSIGYYREKNESDDIFQQLNDEINADLYDISNSNKLSPQEEIEENNRIFKELLDETSTPKPVKKIYKNSVERKNAEMLERVSDAIAKLTLSRHQKGNKNGLFFDASLLGVIRDFVGSFSGGRK